MTYISGNDEHENQQYQITIIIKDTKNFTKEQLSHTTSTAVICHLIHNKTDTLNWTTWSNTRFRKLLKRAKPALFEKIVQETQGYLYETDTISLFLTEPHLKAETPEIFKRAQVSGLTVIDTVLLPAVIEGATLSEGLITPLTSDNTANNRPVTRSNVSHHNDNTDKNVRNKPTTQETDTTVVSETFQKLSATELSESEVDRTERELLIVVNDSLDMSVSKSAIAASHAAQLALFKMLQAADDETNDHYKEWADSNYKMEVQFNKELPVESFSAVHDAGLTEVTPGSVTAVSLWKGETL